MNLTTAAIILNLLQSGFSLQRLKACLDAMGVPASEYADVDIPALKAALKGEEPPE